MMLNLFYRKNGSITVFLSLILVPVLLFMSIMVDGSAYVLSKGSVESAGELAVNAALADYDTVLKEVYGLFAMSQAAEDPQTALKENVTDYFQNSLKANGIIDKDSVWESETLQMLEDMVDDAMGIDSASIPSLVRVDVEDGLEVNYIEGSSLANPDILWAQIVDYSQYRAPLNAGLSVLDSLGAFKKVAEQSEVLDTKTKVDDELSDVNKELKNLYDTIQKFDEKVAALQEALDKAVEADFSFEEAEKALLVCHSMLLEVELEPLAKCDTHGNYSSNYDSLVFLKKDANDELSFVTAKDGTETAQTIGYWKKDQLLSAIEAQFNTKKQDAATASQALAAYYDNVIGYATYGGMTLEEPCNTAQNTNPTKLKEAMELYKDLSKALTEMEACRVSLESAKMDSYEYPDTVYQVSDEDIKNQLGTVTYPEGATDAQKQAIYDAAWAAAKEKAIDVRKAEYDAAQRQIFETNKADLEKEFITAMKVYGNNSNKCLQALKTYQSNYRIYHERLKDYLAKITDLLGPIATPALELAMADSFNWNGFHSSYGTCAHNVREAAGNVKKQITELKEAVTAHQQSIDNYKTNACETGEDSFSSNMSTKAKEIAEKYDEEDIDEIIDQVNAVEKYMTSSANPMGLEATLKSYQLGGIVIGSYMQGYNSGNLSQMEGMIDAMVNGYRANAGVRTAWESSKTGSYYQLDSGTLEMAKLNNMDTSVMYHMGEQPSNPYNAYNTDNTCYLKRIGQTGVKPASMPAGSGETVNIPAFYFYLITCFGYKPEEKSEITKESVNSYQEQQEGEAAEKNDEGIDFSYSMSLFEDAPTKDSNGDETGEKPDDKGSPFDFFRRSVATFKDIIYAVTHLEGQNVVETLLVEEYIMNNFSRYSDVTGQKTAASGQSGGSGEGEYKPRKTYSNVEINAQNNAMYGCEVEYILYGKKGSEASHFLLFTWGEDKGPEVNVNCAKEDIFAVRMMFNTVFALTDTQIDNETLPPAMAIQAASAGVFPYQVAQTIIKLCLALAESNYDVAQIVEENKDMPLIKTKETWKFQLSGIKDALKEKVSEVVDNTVNEALEQGQDIVKRGLQDAIDGAERELGEMFQEIGDNINVTIQGCINDNVNAVTKCYTSTIESYYQQILTVGKKYNREELITMCQQAANEYLNQINLNEETRTLITNNLIPELTNTLLPEGGELDQAMKQTQDIVSSTAGEAKDFAQQLGENFSNTMNSISEQAQAAVNNIADQIQATSRDIADKVSSATMEVVDETFAKMEGEADSVSAKISGTINEKLDEFFPSASVTTSVEIGGDKTSSALGTSFVMGYDDYIRVFLFIKLMGAQSDTAMTRVADVIQINVNSGLNDYGKTDYMHPVRGNFRMSKANTYMQINADVKVEPLLISQDWFERMSGGRINYLHYKYSTFAGY